MYLFNDCRVLLPRDECLEETCDDASELLSVEYSAAKSVLNFCNPLTLVVVLVCTSSITLESTDSLSDWGSRALKIPGSSSDKSVKAACNALWDRLAAVSSMEC